MDINQLNSKENTPRTKNRLFDNTIRLPHRTPEGYTRDDWSQRKQIEADFCGLGFSSKKFSHKNENVNRQADSLLLSWVPWGKSNSTERLAIDTIEIRVTFYPNVTVYDISRTERIGACMPKKMGKTQFREVYSKESGALDYVKYLLQKPYVRF